MPEPSDLILSHHESHEFTAGLSVQYLIKTWQLDGELGSIALSTTFGDEIIQDVEALSARPWFEGQNHDLNSMYGKSIESGLTEAVNVSVLNAGNIRDLLTHFYQESFVTN